MEGGKVVSQARNGEDLLQWCLEVSQGVDPFRGYFIYDSMPLSIPVVTYFFRSMDLLLIINIPICVRFRPEDMRAILLIDILL